MPELPEVQALVDFLAERTDGLAITGVELASFSVLKTFNPPPQALEGAPVDGVHRHGKFLDIDADGTHLVFHLARAGWLRWSDQLPATVVRPGKSPIALRVRLSDGSGFDLTEAGTKKSLAAFIVKDPAEVPGIARLGPDPMADDFSLERFRSMLDGRRTQIKGLLRGDPPRREDQPLRDRRLARSRGRRPVVCRPARHAEGRGRDGVGQAGQGAQGRQARRHAGPRPHR